MELEELAEPADERMAVYLANDIPDCSPEYWVDHEAAVPAWVDAYEV
jgi:hypothetical protein